MKRQFGIVVLLAMMLASTSAHAAPRDRVVDLLVFTETTGFRHDSVVDGMRFFDRLSAKDELQGVDFRVIHAPDSVGRFTDKGLAPFEVVVFLSNTGNPLNVTEQAAFERFIRRGGGFVGVHAAADNEYTWPWYGDLVGAYFEGHPLGTPRATLHVEDGRHAATRNLPKRWSRSDEWYAFRANPRQYTCHTEPEIAGMETQNLLEPVPGLPHPGPAVTSRVQAPAVPDDRPQNCGVHVLMTLDDSSYDPSAPKSTGPGSEGDHPIAWCHSYDGGRSFYTGLGHTSESWTDARFAKHLIGGLLSAAGHVPCVTPPPRKSNG